MPDINRLPPGVVNQIAAGEVIERPASVVKELVENSVDAGARRIDVSLARGGSDLIRVVDDGCGIPSDQLPLALASHATSKLREADDLFRVETMGFRGEALASIASISRLVLRSRGGTEESGTEIESAGGRTTDAKPCGCPRGTTLEVRDLFFNTPVRRKFLRSTQTEAGHATEAFVRLALAHPHVHFTLRHNDRQIHELPPTDDFADRIGRIFGPDLVAALIPVESTDERVSLSGYVANPSNNRGNTRMQYLFLNGRFIRDRSLGHALAEAYRGLLPVGRYAVSFLMLRMPAQLVDVNVHPTKLEVRFQDGGRLYSQLLGTLRNKFLTTDLTARLVPTGDDEVASAHDPGRAQQLRQQLVGWAKGQVETWSDQPAASRSLPSSPPPGQLELNPLPRASMTMSPPGVSGDHGPRTYEPTRSFAMSSGDVTASSADVPAAGLQIHNRYLVAESADGVVVIDQHALHERILYEQLRVKVLAGDLESQGLLVPEPVDLSPAEAAAVVGQRELLAHLGIQIEPFGGDTVLVLSHPAMLANMNSVDVLRELADRLCCEGKPPQRRDLLDELLHMMSCKAAVKAGDRLTTAEINALLEQRHLVQDAHHCPHGRPTALVFTRQELDRQFKRT